MSILGLQRRGEILAWPVDDVALLREEAHGRLEATHRDGQVAHRPGPLRPTPPLHQVDPTTLVHPRHVRQVGQELHVPGGWRLPAAPLGPPPPPEPGNDVLYVERHPEGWRWVSATGEATTADPPPDEPWLAPAGHRWLGLHQLDKLHRHEDRWHATFRDGRSLPLTDPALRSVCAHLGLPGRDPREGPAPVSALFRRNLRDWPVELLFASAEYLRTHLREDLDEIVGNALWQVLRTRQRTSADRYGRTPRGLWYSPVQPILQRLGIEATPDRCGLILTTMIGDERLMTFREMRLGDPRPDLRRIGARDPLLVICCEKTGMQEDAFALADHFGASALVLTGAPSLQETECLVHHLPPGEVRVMTHVDWDVGGWSVARGFVKQLHRFGRNAGIVGHLVRPERFTAEELGTLSFEIRPEGNSAQKKAELWLRETGGIGGLLRGIHADHLRPFERLVQAFLEEMARA